MKQIPEIAVAFDRVGTYWDHQQHGDLPPSNLRAGEACRFTFPFPKRGQRDGPIEVIGHTIAVYVYDHFHNSRDHSGGFLCLQGWIEKEPGWPLWEHFCIRNLIAQSLSEIRRSHQPIFLSLTPNTLCKKGGEE